MKKKLIWGVYIIKRYGGRKGVTALWHDGVTAENDSDTQGLKKGVKA